MALVDLICLANSYKEGGRCVVGLRTDGGGFVRPVAPDTPAGQLLWRHYKLENGSEPAVLDLISVDLDRTNPEPGYPENWLIGAQSWLLRKRPVGGDSEPLLQAALRSRSWLLLGTMGNRVPEAEAARASVSFALVAPSKLEWSLDRREDQRPHPRVRFHLSGHEYNLPVTDPIWIPRITRAVGPLPPGLYRRDIVGIQPKDRVFIAVSLSAPFQGYCYKLAAGIVVLPFSAPTSSSKTGSA